MKKLINRLSPLVILFFGGIFLTIGDMFAAEWVRSEGGSILFLVTMLLYIIAMVFLVTSYEKEDIPVATVILITFNIIILAIVGIMIFEEELTLQKIIGIVLGLISLMFLEFGKKEVFISKK
jgi:multidrug transporter EmrE-like cation transporter